MPWARSPLRWGIFLTSLAVSLLLTVLFWPNAFFLAFVLPFLPLGGSSARPASRRCPRCGWETGDPNDVFCPRDAERLA